MEEGYRSLSERSGRSRRRASAQCGFADGFFECLPTDGPDISDIKGSSDDVWSWSAVVERLQADGYHVTAPQFPESSLAADVARLRRVLARQDGPTIVAGHSYGSQIITALGTDAPNAVGLVYIAAFGLDEGESIGALLAQGPPIPALAHLEVDEQGFAWLPEDDFVNHFAADVDPVKARVMHAVQQPLSWSALDEVMGVPAWKSHPCWFRGQLNTPGSTDHQHPGRSGRCHINRGVPDDLPKVAVGILEVSRVDAPRPLVRWVGDDRSGCFGARDDIVHLGSAGHDMADTELARLGWGQRDHGVFGEFGAWVGRKHESSVQMEHRSGSVGSPFVSFELGTNQSFGVKVQPVAVEG